jgi:hypothetical protein
MLRLVFNPQGDLRRAAQACEEDVFAARYGNSAAQMAEEYGPYDAASVFVAVADDQNDVVAAARLIVPNPAGLKTIVDLGRPPWNLDGPRSAEAAGLDLTETWDIASIAVKNTSVASPKQPGLALWYGIFAAPRANQARAVVAILDTRVRRLMNLMGLLSYPLPATTPGPYLGSAESVPAYGFLQELLADQGRLAPKLHHTLGRGEGLSDVEIPKPEAFSLLEAPHGACLHLPADTALQNT